MGTFTSAELVAAVSNAGGLGILGASGRPLENLEAEINKIKHLTTKPFGVNYLVTNYTEESLTISLDSKVPVISTALDDPSKLVKKVHEAGLLSMHQVHSRKQALQAKERGVDIIIAQGSEAGGYGQWTSSFPLIPQVVDAVKPIPVVAAGGIVDGRGLAAALMLGAQGVSMGTRFLASVEAPIGEEWKNMIVHLNQKIRLKLALSMILLPNGALGYVTIPRALNTDFIKKWEGKTEEVKKNADELRKEIGLAAMQRRFHEYVPFAGESAGLIRDILHADEIVHRVATEAMKLLKSCSKF